MRFWIHVIGNSIICLPIAVDIGSDLKLGPTVYAQHLVILEVCVRYLYVYICMHLLVCL